MQHTQKLESLGVLAGGIAHDFNNLLMGMLGYADLAKTTILPESPAYTHLNSIENSARRAADLTSQLLAYSGKGKYVIVLLGSWDQVLPGSYRNHSPGMNLKLR